DKLAAFVLEPGQGVMIHEGVWHNSVSLGPAYYANVTRKNPDEGTTRVQPGGLIPRDRKYIGSVDFAKRDGKIIKVSLSKAGFFGRFDPAKDLPWRKSGRRATCRDV